MTKAWLVKITDEQYEWIKSVVELTKETGANIIRAAVQKAMEDEDFKATLAITNLKQELDGLVAKKAQLAIQEKELQKRLKEANSR